MKNGEIVEANYQVSNSDLKNEMAISSEDIARVANHLKLVKQVINEVLTEGTEGSGDYGVIPGAGKKKVLLKPGAEKLMMLFGLGVRVREVSNEIDRYENFASYSYEAEVYHLKSGIVKANCIGTTSSWEKKYKERSVYVNGVFAGKEATPISDILNTLQKMAQKRAIVGAVILATGASDYFTQDEEDIEAQKPQQKEAKKTDVSRFQEGSQDWSDYVAPLGKFKGKKLRDIPSKELSGYIEYMTSGDNKIDGQLKEFVDRSREYLRTVKA